MDSKNKKNSMSSPVFGDTVTQLILKSIVSAVAIFYIIGFIVVNSCYSKFGNFEYELFQARYIAAGLNFILVHIGMSAMISIIAFILKDLKYIWITLFFVIWTVLGTNIYIGANKFYISTNKFSLIFLILINILTIFLTAYQIFSSWLKSDHTYFYSNFMNNDFSESLFNLLKISVMITLFISSSTIWGSSFWLTMSPTLGGGRPIEAKLVFIKSNLPENTFIPMHNNSISKQVPILFETSSELAILLNLDKKPVAIKIQKSFIYEVIYAPSGPFGDKQLLPLEPPKSTP